jgi:hypothetical protein
VRAVLLPLVTGLIADGPPPVRAALAAVLARPGSPASRPLRQELLARLLASEGETVHAGVVQAVVPGSAQAGGPGSAQATVPGAAQAVVPGAEARRAPPARRPDSCHSAEDAAAGAPAG